MCVFFRQGWLWIDDFSQNNLITSCSFTFIASASLTAPHGNAVESSHTNSFNVSSLFPFLHRAATVSTRWTPTDRRPTLSSTTTLATPLTTTPGGANRKAYPGHRPTATRSLSQASRITAPRRRCLLYLRCRPSSVLPAPSLSKPRASPRAKAACSGQKVVGLPPPPSRAPTLPASTTPSTGPLAA